MAWTEKQRKERHLLQKEFTRAFRSAVKNPGFVYKKKGTYGPFFSEDEALKKLRKKYKI